ncbi:MAG: tRNA (N6-isopentenyl adenosine(37)-C2)-methylthiotransferase MiaB [Clostridia bacterium]|nr:tRNA (N6-isopentenyl adenosine(37)-C2)-methylthiotransferase MiaB [Clostridia bacterium]
MTKIISKEELEYQRKYAEKVRLILNGLSSERGEALRFSVVTYGCQQNEADSERLAGMLSDMGYEKTDDVKEADLILVNTCAVREHAEVRALSVTGQYKHLKEKKPSLMIGVCGCMVSQEHRLDDIKFKYPYVDFAFGTSYLWQLPSIIYARLTKKKRLFMLDAEDEGNIAEDLPVMRECSYRAWLSVMYGCNNYCTYCVVPHVRGRERSRTKEDIIKEAKELIADGVKDITLLGQNVNSYGKTLYPDYGFAELLSDINAIDGDFTLRFMTSHPKDATKKLIDTMARCEKCAPQLHLPLQSGSDRILKRMNRRYTLESYKELVSYAREKIPGVVLTSDIIVGFPGETEEDFDLTMQALSDIKYDMVYSFIYSKRKNTPAAEYEDQVPDDIKGERFRRMLDLQNGIGQKINETYLNKTVRVLCDGISKTDADMLAGRTDGGKNVCFSGKAEEGEYVNVKITEARPFVLIGEIM